MQSHVNDIVWRLDNLIIEKISLFFIKNKKV